jgi:hypothetical protein
MGDKSDHRLLLRLWLDCIKAFNKRISHPFVSLVHVHNRTNSVYSSLALRKVAYLLSTSLTSSVGLVNQ